MALPVLAGIGARFIASHVAKKVAQRAAARQAAKIAAERAAAKPALNLAERGAEIVAKRNAAQQGFHKSQLGKEFDKGIKAFKDDAAKITSSADKRLATAGGAGMLGLLGVVAKEEFDRRNDRINTQRDR